MLLTLITLQLSAQEYEYIFETVPLTNREVIVHSRSYNWNPLDHTDNKNSIEFKVPENTVAIVYAYCSRLSEVSVPELQLFSGVTQCVSSVVSYVNTNLGAGLNKISEGLYGLSLPSGTGDVDIYIFTDKYYINAFREASTSDCQMLYYDAKYDLLSQKNGYKIIKLADQVEESFYVYLGLLNKDIDDAITVRVEAVAITAEKVLIAQNENSVNGTISTFADLPESNNIGLVVIILIAIVAAILIIATKIKAGKKTNTKEETIETEEQKRICKMRKYVDTMIQDAQTLNSKIQTDIENIKQEANKAIADLYGQFVEIPHTELFNNYSFVVDKFGDNVDSTPKLQCDRNVKDAQHAIHNKLELIGKNNKVIAKGQELTNKLIKQYEIQSQIEQQKKFNQQIHSSANDSESDTEKQILASESMNQINDEVINFEKEIEEIRRCEVEFDSIKI